MKLKQKEFDDNSVILKNKVENNHKKNTKKNLNDAMMTSIAGISAAIKNTG